MIGILWDLDGTLLDTLQDLADGTNYALRAYDLPERSLSEIRQFVGNGARNLLIRATDGREDVDDFLAAFHEYYDIHCQDKTAPYPGILETLALLQEKYAMAIVSNKPNVAVQPLCDQYFPGIYARGEITGCPRKPAPDMVYAAMEAIGADKCIYIGDSEVDVATAKNANIPCLSVLWGFRDREVMVNAGAKYFCEKVEDLPQMIEKIVGEVYGK